MDDQRETTRGVLVDTEAIRTWSAERGVVPVYYPERDQYEMVYEGDITEDSERHEWDEFSERFADRDEALVYDDTDDTDDADGDTPAARFVDRREARGTPETDDETSGVTPETDDETSGVTPETGGDETSTAAWDVSAEDESEDETRADYEVDRAGPTDDHGRVDPNEDVAGTADPHADGTATTDLAGDESATDGETGTERKTETETEADGPAGIGTGTATVDVSTVDASDQGKRVFDRDGNEVGIVEAVDEDDERLYVDPDPGLLDEVKTELGWGSQDADDHVIVPSQIASREGHQIVVYGG
jgi:hypothetical protein